MAKIKNYKEGAIMGNYQIKVNIEIVECKDSITNTIDKTADGEFRFTISEAEAINIDKCEHALLEVNYPAVREAISKHLENISKKKPSRQKKKGN